MNDPDLRLMAVLAYLFGDMPTPNVLHRRMLVLTVIVGHVSQSDLARRLGVSHTSIWKQVAKARREINENLNKMRIDEGSDGCNEP